MTAGPGRLILKSTIRDLGILYDEALKGENSLDPKEIVRVMKMFAEIAYSNLMASDMALLKSISIQHS